MLQTARRHEKLAVRLALIISRLNAGETLNMRLLATEFGVSLRTLRRDFRERLMYLDLEYRDGTCRLLSGNHQRELAALTFIRKSGIEALFPDMDSHMINTLLSGSAEPPCVIWTESLAPSKSGLFTRLARAISERHRVTLLIDGSRCAELAPYRLIFYIGRWYLVGEHHQQLRVFLLNDILAVTYHSTLFMPEVQIQKIVTNPDFLKALPHFHVFHSLLSCTSYSSSHQKELLS